MIYCSSCGAQNSRAVPEGDNRLRSVCPQCATVYYDNPKVIVSCLAYTGDKLVWVKRAEEPRRGYWVIPAGYLETKESLGQGAVRELMEETGLSVQPNSVSLYTLGTLQYTDEVYIVFRAKLENTNYQANHEVLEIGLFDEQSAPWNELAYEVMEPYIRRFYAELRKQRFSPYIGNFTDAGNDVWDIS